MTDYDDRSDRIHKHQLEIIKTQKETITLLKGLVREYLYGSNNRRIREREDLAKRTRAALKQEDE